jgi:FkbM family methyltransferase
MVQLKMTLQAAGFDVVRDPFVRDFLPALAQHGVDTVLDVGANAGQFGYELRRKKFRGRILSVEPLAAAFAELSAAADGDPAWDVERAAVAGQPGRITMNVSGNSASSSVLPILDASVQAAPQTQYVATEEVTATTVDDLIARHGLDASRTLLKIDVQGFEAAVLDGAAASMPHLGAVRLEMSLVPLYQGEALMPEITARLGAAGFELWQLVPGFADPSTRRLFQVDGVFFPRRTGRGAI